MAEVLDQPVTVALLPDVGEVRPHRTTLAVDPMASHAPEPLIEGPPRYDCGIGPLHRLQIAHGQPDQDKDTDQEHRPHADHERQAMKRSEEHTSELQSRSDLVCRLLL